MLALLGNYPEQTRAYFSAHLPLPADLQAWRVRGVTGAAVFLCRSRLLLLLAPPVAFPPLSVIAAAQEMESYR